LIEEQISNEFTEFTELRHIKHKQVAMASLWLNA